jgi:GTP:adenosylcobinamide-phosphate guanylyltransferase
MQTLQPEQQSFLNQSSRLCVDAVLPAGGRITGEFAAQAGTEIKALIQMGGETLLARLIRALRETGRVERIIVIGAPDALMEAQQCGADVLLPAKPTGTENILSGLEAVSKGRMGLVMPTDLPFVTPQSIVSVLDAGSPDADILVPVVRRTDFETAFPDVSSLYVPLREGEMTLGCAFRLDPQAILRNKASLDRIFNARKSNLAMVKLLGVGFVLRYASKTLSVRHIEKRCQAILRCRGEAVVGAPPVLAYDIDTPEDWAFACRHFAVRKDTEA